MQVIDFNGKTYNWPPTGHTPVLNDIRPRSSYHLTARTMLRLLYPTQRILEEVPLPGTNLHLDFYIPLLKIGIEIQGEQHFQYNTYFFKDKNAFRRAKQNDRNKSEWCKLNNIVLISLNYNETEEQWKNKLQN